MIQGTHEYIAGGYFLSRYLEQTGVTKSKICGWFPWLIVRYPLEG
jgi:hypothetical protein